MTSDGPELSPGSGGGTSSEGASRREDGDSDARKPLQAVPAAQDPISEWLRRCPSCRRFYAMRTRGEETDDLGVRLQKRVCRHCGFQREIVRGLPPESTGRRSGRRVD